MSSEQIKFLKKIFLISLLVIILLFISVSKSSNNTITIATKNLTEQRIVSSMLKHVIERDTGLKVEIKNGMDATSFLHAALTHNDIDMYIEYSSVAFMEIMNQEYTGQSKEEILKYIKDEYPNKYNLEWYTTLGFDNSNTLICGKFCKDNNIKTYSELAKHNFSFGSPAYFYERKDGYDLIKDKYHLSSNVKKEKLDLILVYVAVASGSIDTGLAFTTDAKLQNDSYVVLEDDLNAFPIYDAGIVTSKDTLNTHPEIKPVLKSFNNILTNEIIQKANLEVETTNKNVDDIAIELVDKLNL